MIAVGSPEEEAKMKTINVIRGTAIFVSLFLIIEPAQANAMIPVIVGSRVAMVVALIPVVLIEGFILARYGLGIGQSLWATFLANTASTIAGIPVAIALEVCFCDTLYSEDDSKFSDWTVNEVAFSCFVLFFAMSYGIESWVARSVVENIGQRSINQAVFYGNLTTYSIILIAIIALWICNRSGISLKKRNTVVHKFEPKRKPVEDDFFQFEMDLDWEKALDDLERDPNKKSKLPVANESKANGTDPEAIGKVLPYRLPVNKSTTDDKSLDREKEMTS